MSVAGTWASIQDVADYAGAVVTQEQLNTAQVMIEGLINRIWRSTDSQLKSHYWLSRAVAWQARYVKDNPELINSSPYRSIAQDGFEVSYDVSSLSNSSSSTNRYYSPQALQMLNNMSHGGNTSLQVNSAFQKSRVRQRIGWRKY